MNLKKKYIVIVVPIILILLIGGYSIKKNASANTNNISASDSVKGAGSNISVDSSSSTKKDNNQSVVATPTPTPKDAVPSAPPTAKLNAPNIEQVKSLMKQLTAEKQVSDSQIYIKNNMHFATITFKKDADSKDADEFATKYANLIKQAYNDNNVYVEIIQDGKTLVTKLLK